MRLVGKVALVSGSTRGIGRTIAEMFAKEGAKIAVAGRTVDRGEKVVANIRAAGGEAEFFSLDINDEHSVREVVDATVERFGKLDTLINNAAPTDVVTRTVKPLVDYTTEEWERIMRGTLTGPVFWSCKYAIPHIANAGGGSIVNISSAQAVIGLTGFSAYGAAKGAVNALTPTLAVENASNNIRVNTIVVGRVISHSGDAGVAADGGHLTRLGVPSDIAYAAIWLASDESAFVTGSIVTADGGFTINGDAVMNS